MTAVAPTVSSPESASVAWHQAALLVVAMIAFVWTSDLQGVILHRDEFQTLAQWMQPGLTYLFAAGLALWQWDWVARVFCSRRFMVLAAVAVAGIALASTRRDEPADAGVPVLRAGERERRPVVSHSLAATIKTAWVTPATSHADAQEAPAQDAPDVGYIFDLPAGWTELPRSNMRPVNLRVAGDASAECYVSSLPGQAGGVLDNVNRWRKQMGLPAIDAEALAKLPRSKLFGRDAVIVELDGKFTAMGGTSIDNARLVGAIASLPATMIFLKMTGPRDVVQRERPGFDKVLASLRLRDAAHARPSESRSERPADHPVAEANPAEGIVWSVPDGWQAGAERMMRLVTMNPKAAPEVECYVSVLPGAAGGVLDNVNRWRGQFGLAAATQAEVDACAKVTVLGKEAPLVEASGTFTGMGGSPKADHGLLGTVVPLDNRVVFVKMTGPKAQVQAERARFVAFCRSLSSK